MRKFTMCTLQPATREEQGTLFFRLAHFREDPPSIATTGTEALSKEPWLSLGFCGLPRMSGA